MNSSKIRVLVTCAGSGVAQSVIDSLRYYKETYFVVTSDQGRLKYSVPDCDAFVDLPQITDAGYAAAIRDICKRLAIDVLIPGHDLELELFSRERNQFNAIGTEVAVSGLALTKLLRNKLDWARAFREKTKVIAPSYSVEEVRKGAADGEFPMIAKPAGGSASSDLHILHSVDDAEGLPDDLVVQAFLYPKRSAPEFEAVQSAVQAGKVVQISEVSVQLVYSATGALIGRFASLNRLKGGVPVEIVPIEDEGLWAAVKQIEDVLADMDPVGPINIQGRITDEGVRFFEMNPRFTGITGNRAQFGFNEVDAVCKDLTRQNVPELKVNLSKVGVRQVACRVWPDENFGFRRSARKLATVAVSGGTSWLGRTFIDRCEGAGLQIAVLSRAASVEKTKSQFSHLPFVKVIDSAGPDAMNCLASADALVNLASARPPDGVDAIRSSYEFQVDLMTKAVASQIPFILNVSSQSVYGPSNKAWVEGSGIRTTTPYAFSKYAIETHLRELSFLNPQMAAISLRVARLFGAADGLRDNEFPHKFVKSAVTGGEIVVTAPNDTLDLLDVHDASESIMHFLQAPPEAGSMVYNVGAGRGTTIKEYVDAVGAISQELGLPGPTVSINASEGTQIISGGFMDCGLANEAGWSPNYSIAKSIKSLVSHFQR